MLLPNGHCTYMYGNNMGILYILLKNVRKDVKPVSHAKVWYTCTYEKYIV